MKGEVNSGSWSKELQSLTRKMLEERENRALHNGRFGLAMKAHDGRFGWIEGADIINTCWRIRPLDDEEHWEEEFESIDALLEAGWAVD